ncbi:MAG TPA: histidine kinase dimerization/phosphoacceptor domain -containing protein [Rubellimicrobium sp.]|nr:histidine kinase dimerization/phosphoacceptor domain -containing protein [Rubellimicrobium sp.]
MTEASLGETPGVDAAGPRPARPPRRGEVPLARPPLLQRLGFRLSLLLAVALLPLGIIALLQTGAWLDAAREQRAAVLMGQTLRASAPVTGLIREAQGAAAALAGTVRPLLNDEAACDAVMSEFADEFPRYAVVGYVPLNGRMTCAANDAAYDYAGNPLFEFVVSHLHPSILVNPLSPVAGTSIVLVIHPVTSEPGGANLGYVALAVPHSALGQEEAQAADAAEFAGDAPPDFVTFTKDGTVLTSSTGLDHAAEILPGGLDLRDFTSGRARGFTARTAGGRERFYSTMPLIPNELFALGSVPAREAVSLGPVSILTPFLLTALMWAGSLVVAWVAAEWLVTRYIRRLSRAIRAFASGSRAVGDLDVVRAPAEIREVGQAFVRMTDTILHDEAELENTVHQREVLLREVHHRVKNNLQLIASIMNMQSRRARSPETKALMRGLQDRVMSLATVHKELYQTSGLTDVRADELLGDITRQIVGMASAPGRTFRIDTDFAPILLTPDQAVPLSLLLTEGLTNAIKYAEAEPGETSPALSLRFVPLGEGRAELSIANAAGAVPPPDAPGAEGTGLGRQLVAAFASQLAGEVESEARDGRFVLRVEFALASVRESEARRAE